MNEFFIYKGDVKIFDFRFFDTDGNPLPMLSHYIEVRVKDEKSKKIVIKKSTTDENSVILNGRDDSANYGVKNDNELAVVFYSDDTNKLGVKVYPFVIVIILNDRQYTVYKNDLVVKGNYAV